MLGNMWRMWHASRLQSLLSMCVLAFKISIRIVQTSNKFYSHVLCNKVINNNSVCLHLHFTMFEKIVCLCFMEFLQRLPLN